VRKTSLARVGGLFLAILIIAGGITPASSATATQWGQWGPFEGEARAYTTTVATGAIGFPRADVATDSRAGSGTGVISGASTWLGAGTPVGAIYGSSRGQQYLNLRPNADNAASPSTTTYSFDYPTPSNGWAFVLGDIDADAVSIDAVTADGDAAGADELGFQGGFNYCTPEAAGSCNTQGSAADTPAWDPDTRTLTGNEAAADTAGAAAWFQPTVGLESLTLTFTRRAGFPVYQTWVTSLSRAVTGSVQLEDGTPVPEAAVTLTNETGVEVAVAETTDEGTYAFPEVVAADGFTVTLDAPEGLESEGACAFPVDLTETDVSVPEFVLGTPGPVEVAAIEGAVVSDDVPVEDVVIMAQGEGTDVEVLTDGAGEYAFEELPLGEWTISVDTEDDLSDVEPQEVVAVLTEPGQRLRLDDFVVSGAAAEPVPSEEPGPSEEPEPSSEPSDEPVPGEELEPGPSEEPEPSSEPSEEPVPSPEPSDGPVPSEEPEPSLDPEPSQESSDEPEPSPEPSDELDPELSQNPAPEPSQEQELSEGLEPVPSHEATPSQDPETESSQGALANTGASVLALGVLSSLLLGIGALIAVWVRRQSTH